MSFLISTELVYAEFAFGARAGETAVGGKLYFKERPI